ncbi:RsmB/NOP family class I SAM-dependent RNA methyltransferase [Acutalibacter caecimuris]|uniref:RsmB/NOP family class I SAM-dependent RNA methyltransferase n=1 Tax=Acutalibacter caecimuris TaxID=3093657 RepID=UPI002AC96743|nr:RsmB/NOP family class I SAM-dependent RNA methyltransferase [Acutalibacter sp. M00118]
MGLPEAFLKRMENLLGAEFPAFVEGYARPAFRGVRLNPLACTGAVLRQNLPMALEPAPFSPLSFYAAWAEGFGRLPAHHAGMFYAQEPSAASAVTALDPQPGERVLDLSAAPGGKSTQIAGLLGGRGLLWANEVVKSRASALLSNLERLGVPNAVASCCRPEVLCRGLQGYFHRVLVDAPCSGEGMFRRDPRAVGEWSPQHVEACALRQRAILDAAALAVGTGGVLVYSTCTFSPQENEETAAWFLENHPAFVAEDPLVPLGRPGLQGLGRRIYPMDGGEGHYLIRFRRVGENPSQAGSAVPLPTGAGALAGQELYRQLFTGSPPPLAEVKGTVLIPPPELPGLRGLGVLRAGVELGYQRKNRLEPAHGLFMSRPAGQCLQRLDLPPDSPELAAFLRGEELPCPGRGYIAVCVGGVTTGFGKASQGRLKNHYPKGLRNLR